MVTSPTETVRSGLFLRLWEAERLTPAVARHVLKMGWSEKDRARMGVLNDRNATGTITPAELRELDEYVEVGLTLSILHSRARKVLAGRVARATRARI